MNIRYMYVPAIDCVGTVHYTSIVLLALDLGQATKRMLCARRHCWAP